VLIHAIVNCMKPDPRAHSQFTICDPAVGTAGFLVAAYEWLMPHTSGGALERDVARRVRKSTYFGQELVERPRRLALMNLFLHGIEPTIRLGDTIYEVPGSERFDVILTNPTFGTKGANQAPDRDDFTISTSKEPPRSPRLPIRRLPSMLSHFSPSMPWTTPLSRSGHSPVRS
jgi:type I restriction enzyme M protein